mmetsp:Transcript_49903/g.117427  ORF Transcript_49903/g.117427 Transcript_49903/m.117427 type:complete len:204 (-) Transcript_49903:3211-3822(-)
MQTFRSCSTYLRASQSFREILPSERMSMNRNTVWKRCCSPGPLNLANPIRLHPSSNSRLLICPSASLSLSCLICANAAARVSQFAIIHVVSKRTSAGNLLVKLQKKTSSSPISVCQLPICSKRSFLILKLRWSARHTYSASKTPCLGTFDICSQDLGIPSVSGSTAPSPEVYKGSFRLEGLSFPDSLRRELTNSLSSKFLQLN